MQNVRYILTGTFVQLTFNLVPIQNFIRKSTIFLVRTLKNQDIYLLSIFLVFSAIVFGLS